MIIGCFALVEPLSPIERQFQAISEMGIQYADLTDNHNGGMLGVEYGFTASLSLDIHPARIREMTETAGITLTSVCAHANLLDSPAPDRYGTNEDKLGHEETVGVSIRKTVGWVEANQSILSRYSDPG